MRIVVNCENEMSAGMIQETLRTGDFHITVVKSPVEVISAFNRTVANTVLLELTDKSPWTYDERLVLRNTIRSTDPECKIVFMVDERSFPAIAEKIKWAKIDTLIDQFVFSSVSATYLKALLEATV